MLVPIVRSGGVVAGWRRGGGGGSGAGSSNERSCGANITRSITVFSRHSPKWAKNKNTTAIAVYSLRPRLTSIRICLPSISQITPDASITPPFRSKTAPCLCLVRGLLSGGSETEEGALSISIWCVHRQGHGIHLSYVPHCSQRLHFQPCVDISDPSLVGALCTWPLVTHNSPKYWEWNLD